MGCRGLRAEPGTYPVHFSALSQAPAVCKHKPLCPRESRLLWFSSIRVLPFWIVSVSKAAESMILNRRVQCSLHLVWVLSSECLPLTGDFSRRRAASWELLREPQWLGSTIFTGQEINSGPLRIPGDLCQEVLALQVPAAVLVPRDLTVLPWRFWVGA